MLNFAKKAKNILIFITLLIILYYPSLAEANNLKIDHNTHQCLMNLNTNKEKQAQQYCTKALELNPNNPQAYLYRGLAAYRIGEYENALQDYTQVIQTKPHQMEAYYNRGLVYVALGDNLAAIQDFNQALNLVNFGNDQQLGIIYNDRGIAYLNLKNFKQAISDFKQAIRLDKNNSFFHYNLAFSLQQLGNYYQAINGFNQAISLNHHYTESYIHRGLAYYQLGYYQAALADLKCACDCCQKHEKPKILAIINKIKSNLSQQESIIV